MKPNVTKCNQIRPKKNKHSKFTVRSPRLARMSVIDRSIQVGYRLRVHFTQDVFGRPNPLLKDILVNNEPNTIHRALVVLDESLAHAQAGLLKKIEAYFSCHKDCLNLVCPPFIIEGGERTKNSYFHVSEIQSRIDRHHIDRHSYVIGIGGGALLDMRSEHTSEL